MLVVIGADGRARRGRAPRRRVAASTPRTARRIAAGELRPHRRHAPRLPDRRHAAGHRHRPQMPDALEAVEVRRPAPRRPRACRRARSRARRTPAPTTGSRAAVLDHARGDVRVVVLHRDGREVEVERELRRQVLRVEVVRDDLGRHAVQRGQVVDGLEERLVRGEVLEVADVVARRRRRRPRVTATVALQLGPDREHRARAGERAGGMRLGRVPARPAEHLQPARRSPARRSRRSGCGWRGRG